MIIVTNRIKMKKGFAEKMAPRFTKPGPLQKMNGFVKVEVWITQNLPEHDVVSVNMYWETMEGFTEWRNSDVFKESHSRSGNDGEESPMLGSEIIVSEVASTLEAEKN